MKKVMSVLLALVMIISCIAAMSVTAAARNGNLLYIEYFDAEGNLTSKTVFSYDTNGNLLKAESFDLDSESGELSCTYKEEFAYDEKGNEILDKSYYDYLGTGELELENYLVHEYDEKGNNVKTYDYSDETKATYSEAVNVYSDAGLLISCEHKYFDGTEYTPNQLYTVTYDADDNEIASEYKSYDCETEDYVPSVKYENTYDENGNELTQKYYNYEDGSYVLVSTSTYTYDAEGNVIKYEVVYEDSEDSGFSFEYTFEDGGKTRTTVADWSDSVSKNVGKYDDYGNELSAVEYNKEGDAWVESGRSWEYEYDIEGNVTKMITHQISDGTDYGSTAVYTYEQLPDPTAEEIKASIKIAKQDAEGEADEDAVQAGEGFTMHIGEDTNIAPANLKEVLVDGEVVDAKYYTIEEGSIIVNFTEEFTKTLSNGKHSIQFALQGGYYEGVTLDAYVSITGGTPKTGDTQNMFIYIAAMMLSAAAAVVVIRRKNNG